MNGDTQASLTTQPTISTTGTAASAVGTYPITASGAADANYTISYVAGALSVGQAALTVTADNQSKTYGQANPALTVSYTGFVNGDTQASLTTQPTISTTATTASGVGTYTIKPEGATSANYTFTFINGAMTITPAIRTITFNNLPVKTYGNADFSAGATASSGDAVIYSGYDSSVVTITNGIVHITGTGTNTIIATAATNANYSNAPSQSQTLIVNKADQTINITAIPAQLRGATYDLGVIKSTSGLPITFMSSDPTIIAVSGTTLSSLHIGTAVLTASQMGNSNYNAAANVTAIITVGDEAGDQILVHQALSPNGDGINDYLLIEGIQNYPDNRVTIINRNGVKIFEMRGYDNTSRAFDGHSNITRALQQQGTYFYLVEYTVNGNHKRKTGFFVLRY